MERRIRETSSLELFTGNTMRFFRHQEVRYNLAAKTVISRSRAKSLGVRLSGWSWDGQVVNSWTQKEGQGHEDGPGRPMT